MKSVNCMVAQSGGPTAAINASLAGVIQAAAVSGKYQICYGAVNGITGVLSGKYLDLSEIFKETDRLEKLKNTPAMFLGSSRYKLPDAEKEEEPYRVIFEQFQEKNIGAFFLIGGNDSMDTVLKLSDYAGKHGIDIRIIGVPKTIDNDLCCTDHTPGFGSAAKYIAATILDIAHDTFIYSVKSVTIVELMGRDSGWLTAASVLARNAYNDAPHLIYLPEVPFSTEQFLEDVKGQLQVRNNVIVAVSEGIRNDKGVYLSMEQPSADTFGHMQLSGVGKKLEILVKEKLGVKVRSIEVSVLQRCAAHLASETDQREAFEQGQHAVALAAEGKTAVMVAVRRLADQPYRIQYEYEEIGKIANEVKTVPVEWITEHKNDVKAELLAYLSPLIQGEIELSYQNGLPDYMDITHLIRESIPGTQTS